VVAHARSLAWRRGAEKFAEKGLAKSGFAEYSILQSYLKAPAMLRGNAKNIQLCPCLAMGSTVLFFYAITLYSRVV